MRNGRRKVRRVDSLMPYRQVAQPRFAGIQAPAPQPSRQPSALKKRLVLASLAPVLAALVFLGYLVITHLTGKFNIASLTTSVVKATAGVNAPIKGQERGRTNILVYGMTMDGMRTDSIVLVSYYWQQKKVVTLNIPRDLYVYDGYEYAKMGEVYSYAKTRQPKNSQYPDRYVAALISKEYNLPVDYWIKFNMQGEVDLVNALGGIDINVPDSFTDYEYPNWNYNGYLRPAPRFTAGMQHMNGATALIYSRSRHSLNNDEGSDFARSNRQALVIQAVMTKVKNLGVVGNLADFSRYLTILGKNVDTNMSTDEMVSFAKTTHSLSPSTDFIHGNWATGNGFLCDGTSSSGAYIILYGKEGNCNVGLAGGTSRTNTDKQLAQYYIQNLLNSTAMTPANFVKAADQTLWPSVYPPTSSTTATRKSK